MKRINKIIAFVLIVIYLLPMKVYAKYDNYYDKSLQNVKSFLEGKYDEIMSICNLEREKFGISDGKKIIGKPFIIIDLDVDQQDEIYYVPLLNNDNKAELVISVMGTNVGWNLAIDQDLVEDINKIGITGKEYLFIKSEENLLAIVDDKEYVLRGIKNNKINKFISKKNIGLDTIDPFLSKRFKKVDVTKNLETTKNIKDKYSRSFSTDTYTIKTCALYNEKGQGRYEDCWAASVATIVNYIKGSNISAINVCDKMKIGYNIGATIGEVQLALNKYDISYNYLNNNSSSILSWNDIKTNIDNRYPIYVAARHFKSDGKVEGHAVTLYGYHNLSTKYVCLWNSGLDNGKGGYQVITYNSSRTTFTYGGNTFVWAFSLSYYA